MHKCSRNTVHSVGVGLYPVDQSGFRVRSGRGRTWKVTVSSGIGES